MTNTKQPRTLDVEMGGHQIRVEYEYSPGRPGRTSGPPERCYPDEPAEFSINKASLFVGPTPLHPDSWLDITDLLAEITCSDISILETLAEEELERELADAEAAEAELEADAQDTFEYDERVERDWEANRLGGGE